MGVITEYNVELQEGITLQHYDKLLEKFKEWTEFKRDIKITSLLEGKKIKFDVEDINSSPSQTIFGYRSSYKGKEDEIKPTIEYTAFIVTDMSYIIKDSFIQELKIKIRTIDVNFENMINQDIKFKMKQHIFEDRVSYFYIETENPS